jgi:hypothetical protein
MKHYEALGHQTIMTDNIMAIRDEAIRAGGLDPLILRFNIVEYEKSSGERLGVPHENLGFKDAVESTAALIGERADSHFCLEPVGFIQ